MAFVFLLVWIFFPVGVFAQQAGPVVINEIAWMGSSVDEVNANQHWRYEWLELQSTVERSTMLDGWSVELYRQDELYFHIPLQGIISPNGYFLVGASDKIVNLDINYANLGGKFLNTGMRVTLKDGFGNVIDEVGAQNGWPAGDNTTKRTMERIAGSDPAMWQTSAKVGGTPKAKNSEGFQKQTPLEMISNGASKKDLFGSFQEGIDVFNGTTLLAVLLALGSSVGILGLRRLLVR